MTHEQWIAELLRQATANPTSEYRLVEDVNGREIVEGPPPARKYSGGKLVADAWAMGPGGRVMVKEYNEYDLGRRPERPNG
jgi:hypothetical protein